MVATARFTRDPGDARTGEYYDPASGLRYSLTKGTRTVTEEKYRYSQSGWFGIEATKTKAIQDQYRLSSFDKSNDPLSGRVPRRHHPAFGHDLEHLLLQHRQADLA